MKRKQNFIGAALILIGIVFFCSAVVRAGELRELQKTPCVKLQQDLNAADARKTVDDYRKSEKKKLVFWSKEMSRTCDNPIFNRSVELKEIIFCGELSLLLPQCGATGARDWKQECILDEEAALQLYGSKHATGQRISMGGEEYRIRLTIEGKEGLVIREGRQDEILHYASIEGKQKETEAAIQKLTMNYGIGAKKLLLPLLYGIAAVILSLIPAVCGVLGAIQLLNIWNGNRQKTRIGCLEKSFAGIIVAILILWFCMGLFQSQPGISLYPLSDFDSWSQQVLEIKKQLLTMVSMEKPWMIETFFIVFRQCAGAAAASAVCLFSGIRLLERKKEMECG